VCSSPVCQEARRRFYTAEYEAWRSPIRLKQMREDRAAMSDDEREELNRNHREKLRAWHQGVCADPARYAQYIEKRREYERSRAAAEFLDDAAKLEKKS
ncbi:hypothetical protein QT622_22555, partial [Xanthomonas citri pv. citri]